MGIFNYKKNFISFLFYLKIKTNFIINLNKKMNKMNINNSQNATYK